MFEIEKGVPIPAARPAGKGGRDSKYPFRELETGDSFVVPINGDAAEARRLRVNLMTRCNKYGKSMGRRFTTRLVPEGVRVWRVE